MVEIVFSLSSSSSSCGKAENSSGLMVLIRFLLRSRCRVSDGIPSGTDISFLRWHKTERSWALHSQRDGQPVAEPDSTVPSIKIRMGCQHATRKLCPLTSPATILPVTCTEGEKECWVIKYEIQGIQINKQLYHTVLTELLLGYFLWWAGYGSKTWVNCVFIEYYSM